MFTEDKVLKSLSEAAMRVMMEESIDTVVSGQTVGLTENMQLKPGSPLDDILNRSKENRKNYFKNIQDNQDKAQASRTSSQQQDSEGGREGRNANPLTATGTGKPSNVVKTYGQKVSKHQVPGQRYTANKETMKMINQQDRDILSMKNGADAPPASKAVDAKVETVKAVNPPKANAPAVATPAAAAAGTKPAETGKTVTRTYKSQMQTGKSNRYTGDKATMDMVAKQDADIKSLNEPDKKTGKRVLDKGNYGGKKPTEAAATDTKTAEKAAEKAAPPTETAIQKANREGAERLAAHKKDTKTENQKAHIASSEKDPMGDSDKAQYRSHNDKSNGGSGESTPPAAEKKPSLLDRAKSFASDAASSVAATGSAIKKKAEGLSGYHSATNTQYDSATGKHKDADTGADVDLDDDDKITSRKASVTDAANKKRASNPFGLGENTVITFAGRIASIVESSYTIKESDKSAIYEDIQGKFGSFDRVLTEKESLKLKMSKELSGVGIAPEDSYTEHETGRGKAYSLKAYATAKEKAAYERDRKSEMDKKFDLSGVTEEAKSKALPYHHLDHMSDEEAEKHLDKKYNDDDGDSKKNYHKKSKTYHALEDMTDEEAEKHLKQKYAVDESYSRNTVRGYIKARLHSGE